MIARADKYRFVRRLVVGGLATALLAPCAAVQGAERNVDVRRDRALQRVEGGFQGVQKKKHREKAKVEIEKQKALPNPNQ